MYHVLFQVSVYPIYFDYPFAYSATEKPRQSVKQIYIKLSLSTLTQLLLVLPIL